MEYQTVCYLVVCVILLCLWVREMLQHAATHDEGLRREHHWRDQADSWERSYRNEAEGMKQLLNKVIPEKK